MTDRSEQNVIQRLYHRLLQRRVLSERHYGHPSLFGRLIRIRFVSGLMLSLPALFLTGWYLYLNEQLVFSSRLPSSCFSCIYTIGWFRIGVD